MPLGMASEEQVRVEISNLRTTLEQQITNLGRDLRREIQDAERRLKLNSQQPGYVLTQGSISLSEIIDQVVQRIREEVRQIVKDIVTEILGDLDMESLTDLVYQDIDTERVEQDLAESDKF